MDTPGPIRRRRIPLMLVFDGPRRGPMTNGHPVLTTSLTAVAAAAPLTMFGPGHGPGFGPGAGGFGWLWLLIPLFWLALFVLLFVFVGRRIRRAGGAPWQMRGPSPEQTLGDRFARGEIEEQEYRTRLEVIRASQRR